MKRLARHTFTVIGLVILAAIGSHASPGRRVTLQELKTPPRNAEEARRLRIWIPVERSTACRVRVEILDSTGTVVRHFMSRLLGHGYHNLYWDKRDDSGQQVAPGIYPVTIDNCGTIEETTVEAAYRPFERETELAISADSTGPLINVVVPEKCPSLQFRLATINEEDEGEPVLDTTVSAGEHQIPLRLDPEIPPGRFYLKLYINDVFVRESEFIYRR